MKRNLNDTRAQYQLRMDEAGILLAAEDILRRRLERQGTIGSPTECTDYLRARCAHLANEVFGVLWLDTRHGVIDAEHLFTGTIDGREIHPRIVAKRALETNAAAVVLFHNHPSGNPEPSEADGRITARLKQVLALLTCECWITWCSGALRRPASRSGGSYSPRARSSSLAAAGGVAGVATLARKMRLGGYLGPVFGNAFDALAFLVQPRRGPNPFCPHALPSLGAGG